MMMMTLSEEIIGFDEDGGIMVDVLFDDWMAADV